MVAWAGRIEIPRLEREWDSFLKKKVPLLEWEEQSRTDWNISIKLFTIYLPFVSILN